MRDINPDEPDDVGLLELWMGITPDAWEALGEPTCPDEPGPPPTHPI